MNDDQDDNTIVLGASASTDCMVGGAGIDTITIDPSIYTYSVGSGATVGGITSISGYNGMSYATSIPYTFADSTTSIYGSNSSTVNITTNGISMKDGADITIGKVSLTKAIEKIEERLGILHPNPELEDRWDKLKELRNQYMEMEKDLLEKEKIMKILKET